MRKTVATLTIILLIIVSCQNAQRQENSSNSTISSTDTVEAISIKLNPVHWDSTENLMYYDSISKVYAYNSIFRKSLEMCSYLNDTLIIAIHNGLNEKYNCPLAFYNNLSSFQKNGFSISDTFIIEKDTLYKLNFNNSVVYLNNEKIGYSRIVDSTLDLNFNLKIGMSTDDFIEEIFESRNIKELENLEYFVLTEILGDYYQAYTFEDKKLKMVETYVEYYWMFDELGINWANL